MSTDYYGRLPKLLQDEFLEGRWLPVVGAGMSANAVAPGNRTPPTWNALGEGIVAYLDKSHGTSGPVDAISTFEQRYGRLPLVDKLRDLLLVDEVEPTAVNRAFARIPFDTVVTTNVDFVLEDAWRAIRWPFEPIVGEQRLASRRRTDATLLVKFHGDVHHPNELVVTEGDYDRFLLEYPLLSTFVASLLITRVPVLLGYSADDPDFRALLALLTNRLGRNSSTPWVILAKGSPSQIARYERRGVRVVVLESRSNVGHGTVFSEFFSQLASALPVAAGSRAEATEDALLTELRVSEPSGALVVFLGGNESLARYRESLFPALRARGLIPVSPDEVQSQPSLHLASLTQLLRKASAVVVDLRDRERSGSFELGIVHSAVDPSRIVVVGRPTETRVFDPTNLRVITVDDKDVDPRHEGAVTAILEEQLFSVVAELANPKAAGLSQDSIRGRLRSGDTTMAFLEAVVAVESALRRNPDLRHSPFRQLIHEAGDLLPGTADGLQEAYKLRGEFLHRGIEPPPARARELTRLLLDVLDNL